MTNYRYEALLPTDARRYFVERDSAAYLALQAELLDLGYQKFISSWHDGETAYVRLVTKPNMGAWLPEYARNHLGYDLEFVDTIEVRPALVRAPPYQLLVQTEVPGLGGKVDIRSTLTIEDMAEGLTRQVLEGSVNIRVWGLGRIAENMVMKSMKQTYDRLPQVVAEWERVRSLREPASGGEARLLPGRPEVLNVDADKEESLDTRCNMPRSSTQTTLFYSVKDSSFDGLPPELQRNSLTGHLNAQRSLSSQMIGGYEDQDSVPEGGSPPSMGRASTSDLSTYQGRCESFNQDSAAWSDYWRAMDVRIGRPHVRVERLGRVVQACQHFFQNKRSQSNQTRAHFSGHSNIDSRLRFAKCFCGIHAPS